MVGILTRFKVLPGKEADALAFLRDVASQVEADEPGTYAYTFFKTRNDPQEIVVFEIFASADARSAHTQGPIVAAAKSKLKDLADMSTFKSEALEEPISGFLR